MFKRIRLKGLCARPMSLRRAVAWLLARILAPLIIGAAMLVLAIWSGEQSHTEKHLHEWAAGVVHEVNMYLAHGRSQMEAIAALDEIDKGEMERVYRLAKDVVHDHPGTAISLVRPDGQFLFNTAVPFNSPLPNLWRLQESDRKAGLHGRRVPISSQGLTREVFRTGEPAYSGVFMGLFVAEPRLAFAIPVYRKGAVVSALMLSFPVSDLKRLLANAGLPRQATVALIDRDGTIVEGNDASRYKTGDKSPIPLPLKGTRELADEDGMPSTAASAVTDVGYSVLVSMPTATALSDARRALIGWSLVTACAIVLSILGVANFNRRLSEPLRLLAARALAGGTPELPPDSNIHEIELLAAALRAAERNNELRRQEHIALVEAEQKREAVQAHEAQMQRVFAGLQVSVTILDLEGRVIEMNHAPAQCSDVSRSEALGRPVWDCCWWSYDPAVQRTVRESVTEAREGREAIRFNLPARMGDGRIGMLDFQLSPLADDDGKIHKLIACAVDVQERVDAIRSLQVREAQAREIAAGLDKQRALLDAVLQATPAGMVVCNADGRIVSMNQANLRLWGGAPPSMSLDEASYKGWWAAGEPREGELVQPQEWPLSNALRTARAQSAVIDVQPFDGSARKTVQINAAPVLDADGSVAAGVAVQMDITDRVRWEATLQEADRHKDEFLATLGHELRNPLAPIRSAVHLLGKYPATEPRLIRAQRVIERQTGHMARLVDDLLDLARITQGTIKLQRATVLLQELMVSAVEAIGPVLEAKGVALREQFAPQPLYVEVDSTRLTQALINLLANACKFTDAGGQITLGLRSDGGCAVIEVSDNGIGLAPDAVERIFGLFVQEQPSGVSGNTGLGIGLALSRDLIRLHGGSLDAKSSGLGKGSTFTARLPLVEAPAPAATAMPAIGTLEDRPGAPYRVLVVDDNRDACDLMKELLEMSGFEATGAYDGANALAAVEKARHDAFVLDIGLPDMTGYELCQRIRSEVGSGPVMLALTGWGQDQDKKAAAQAGFDAHVTKPADPDVLHGTLAKLLKDRRAMAATGEASVSFTVRPSPIRFADSKAGFAAAAGPKRLTM